MDIHVQYKFCPVGQGLFSAGRLALETHSANPYRPDFQWVYDCGTTSSQRFVEKSVSNFKNRIHGRKLDLIVVSHFDTDHISGLVQLLNDVGTNTLMLPWAPLWHRLVIGYAQGLAFNDRELSFYTDPVRFLIEEAGDGFDTIVFVPFSDGDGPPDSDGGGEPVIGPDGDLPLQIEFDDQVRSESEGYEQSDMRDWQRRVEGSSHNVQMMRSNGKAFLPALWEFVPYNDPATRPRNEPQFIELVNDLRDSLLNSPPPEKDAALSDLKGLYTRIFPKSQQNDLSLFFYGGPIGNWNCECCWPLHNCNGSIIYTGDGNLSTNQKWDTLRSYWGRNRSYNPTVLQVPHHGSKHNWYVGLANLLAPGFSIFSSDPDHRGFGHPHAEVLRDLWTYHPIQVDKTHEISLSFSLRKP